MGTGHAGVDTQLEGDLAVITRMVGTATTRGRAVTVILALLVAATLQLIGANPAVSQSAAVEAMLVDGVPDLEPGSSIWNRAPAAEVPLSAQSVIYPFGGSALPAVRVQAVHDGTELFIRVSWPDSTADMSTVGSEDFADAVAVQFPAIAASSAPPLCMGQADQGVNIWHWRADDLPSSVEELHADGYVDQYPSTDDLYFPARAAGNPYALPSLGPVQDLVAVGFGTLGPSAEQTVAGSGHWDRDEWAVVFSRPLSSADAQRPAFDVGTTTDIAVAAWDGAAGDRNGQKAVSAFLQLSISGDDLPAAPRSDVALLLIIGATVVVVIAAGLGFTFLLEPRGTRAR